MKKSLKKFIFNKLDNGEYITDSELSKFYGGEPNYYQAETYKKQWRRIERDRNFFGENNPTKIHIYKRRYIASYDGEKWYKISKDYFNIILPKYKRNEERLDLKDIFDYDLM